jgi:hypothetical protein
MAGRAEGHGASLATLRVSAILTGAVGGRAAFSATGFGRTANWAGAGEAMRFEAGTISNEIADAFGGAGFIRAGQLTITAASKPPCSRAAAAHPSQSRHSPLSWRRLLAAGSACTVPLMAARNPGPHRRAQRSLSHRQLFACCGTFTTYSLFSVNNVNKQLTVAPRQFVMLRKALPE